MNLSSLKAGSLWRQIPIGTRTACLLSNMKYTWDSHIKRFYFWFLDISFFQSWGLMKIFWMKAKFGNLKNTEEYNLFTFFKASTFLKPAPSSRMWAELIYRYGVLDSVQTNVRTYMYIISKIQLVVYYQCCVLIGWATTRLYVIAH